MPSLINTPQLRRRWRAALALVAIAAAAVPIAAPAASAVTITSGWTAGPSLPSTFSPRWDFSYAYFPPKDQVVLFGGSPKNTGEGWRRDTWIFSGGTWKLGPAAPAALTARGGAAMAYMPDIGKLVMFGGANSSWPPLKQTWLYDGTKWSQGPTAPAALAGRTGAQMAYHPGIKKLVMFGGSGVKPYNDTWLFDGSSWSPGPATPAAMGPRTFFGMTYDQTSKKVVVAGGNGRPDTWLFDGTGWVAGPAMPAPKERFRMAYDPQLSGNLMCSGLGPASATPDCYVMKGNVWTHYVRPSRKVSWPEARVDGALLWHPVKQRMMVFSGVMDYDGGKQGYRDTWFLNGAPLSQVTATMTTSPAPAQAALPAPGQVIRNVPATGQVVAKDSQFWLGSTPVMFKGVNAAVGTREHEFQQFGLWGMNFVRLRFHWTELEEKPPTKNADGVTWTHHYDQAYMALIKQDVAWAAANGLYVMVDNHPCSSDQECFFGYPDWLYQAPYNSKGITYPKTSAGILSAQTHLWTDTRRQNFFIDMWKFVAGNLKGLPGVIGHEILSEPQPGDYDNSHATTQMMLNWQLKVAQAIRAADPPRVVAFTTRFGFGPGLPQADLSGWKTLGNVAFDLHDYFGARWGPGIDLDTSNAGYGEFMSVLFDHVLNGSGGPYIGTTQVHTQMVRNRMDSLKKWGIPIWIGEMGDLRDDPGVKTFFGTTLNAFNELGVSWAPTYQGVYGFADSDGQLEPWGQIVLDAL